MENRTDQRVFWHGKLKKESRKTWQATALTALCSVALFCLLFSYKKMYPFGDGSVAITDLYSQYLPLLYHFYDVVTGQKNLFLDFSVSGGANLYSRAFVSGTGSICGCIRSVGCNADAAGRRKYAGKGAFVRAKKAAAEGRLPPV